MALTASTIHVTRHDDGVVELQAPLSSGDTPGGPVIGDVRRYVKPGESALGVPYEVWAGHHGEAVAIEAMQDETQRRTAARRARRWR